MTTRQMLRVAFRADASVRIGTGHVMRCLTLADRLVQAGAVCFFVVRNHAGLADTLRARGHGVLELPPMQPVDPGWCGAPSAATEPAHGDWLGVPWDVDARDTAAALRMVSPDWMVVDHYALDVRWEQQIQGVVRRVMVIDDLADRAHACALLLDFNAFADARARYGARVPATTGCLIGERYALLRPEFAHARATLPAFEARRRLFIGFGGADEDDCTLRSVRAAQPLIARGVGCDVVVGQAYPHLARLRRVIDGLASDRIVLHVATTEVAAIMGRCRLAVCGGGVSTWERMCMGLPSLVLAVADNQLQPLRHLHSRGLIRLLGSAAEVSDDDLARELGRLWDDEAALEAIGRHGAALVDGAGADRVVERMLAEGDAAPHLAPVYLARLAALHLPALTAWKNDREIAHQIAAHPGHVSEEEVRLWLERNSADPNQRLLGIFDARDHAVIGVARLMFIDWASGVAELGIFIGRADRRGARRGRWAVRHLLELAFGQLGLYRVHLRVMADNLAAIRCYQACGFVAEGTLRSHFMSDAVRYDMHQMGILLPEFEALPRQPWADR